jgi:iron(III) transport system ATP-binding protein
MFLQLQNTTIEYAAAAKPAVVDCSLSLNTGEIGVLLGPSGCGKTTLLRAIAGLQSIQSGQIELAGEIISGGQIHIAPSLRKVGMVFQDYALFPHLTVEQNISFGLKQLEVKAQKARVAEVLDLVGLPQYGKKMPHELSGGQQQRVALARSLAPQPSLLLLDEPFSNLDADLKERLAQELRQILKISGTTALFVSHDQQEAFAIADKIGIMNQGVLEQWDDAYTIYHQPKTRFVAQFMGDGVFIKAKASQQNQQIIYDTALGQLVQDVEPQSKDHKSQAISNGNCELFIRADDLVHVDSSNVKAKIKNRSFRGAEFLYTLELANGEKVYSLVPSHHQHQIGEAIGFEVQADHLVSFPIVETH